MADELAQRLKRMVPPQALGIGPPPQIQAQMAELTKQNASLNNIVAELTKKIAEDAIKLRGKDEELKGREQLRDIEIYRAETDRLVGLAKAEKDAAAHFLNIQALEQKTVNDAMSIHLDAISQANAQTASDGQQQ
jgi:hypothetical protein